MNSKKFALNVVSRLKKLFDIYEDYAIRHEKSLLRLFMYDNQIFFNLYEGNEEVGNMGVYFDEKDRKIYEYICIMLMINIFSKVIIHNQHNFFYNEIHMPYFELVVLDLNLIEEMLAIKELQNTEHINEEIDIVKKREKKLPIRIYLNSVIDDIDNRINISRDILGR